MMDPTIDTILLKETIRQHDNIQLIASENFVSQDILRLNGSIFTNKYAEGYPGRRYYKGCENMDTAESLAIQYATELFDCKFANVQPHSGAQANLAVLLAFLNPGDTILGMDLASGGHLSHGAKVNVSGKWFNSISYGVRKDGYIDYNQVSDLAHEYKPKLIISGASAYPRIIEWSRFQDTANAVGALHMADMAHYAGLIAGRSYPSPVGFADIITSTTHKTLRGPRGGIILWDNEEYTKKINSAVFPGEQGGPLMHTVLAKAQCFYEALHPLSFSVYTSKVIEHARVMVDVFNTRGVQVVSGGTDSHIVLLDLRHYNITGKAVADTLDREHNITVNMNGVPNDPRPFTQTSGIRIGTAAETTRGHDADWFAGVAHKICDVIFKLAEI